VQEHTVQQSAAPTVSVIIPCYNQPEDLRRCLNSLVAQSYTDFEVLVCDDGSTEDTASVAQAFTDQFTLTFLSDANFGGPARPRNRGITAAKGRYVAFLDADDWWAPDKLAHSVATLEAGADVVYHDLYVVRSVEQDRFSDKITSTLLPSPVFETLLCDGASVPNSSAVVRKTCLENMGQITENRDLISVEDYDTWVRLSQITERFVRLKDCLGYYWVGGGNISTPSLKQMDRIQKLYAQYLEILEPSQKKRASGFLAYRVGRIGVACGAYQDARQFLTDALFSPIPWAYRVKAAIFLTQAIMKSERP